MNAHELMSNVMDRLAQLRTNTQSAEEQELLAVAIDAMLFIVSTGQRYAFIDYREQSSLDVSQPIVASFKTRDEAEAWLKNHPSPPDGTFVLIAGQHHHVVYSREENLRRLISVPFDPKA
jgi:hypothetical protein